MDLQISTIEIPVAKLDRAVAWYQNVLNFNLDWSDEHHAVLNSGNAKENVKILLVETQDQQRLVFESTHTSIRHSVLDFKTNALDDIHARLKERMPSLMDIPKPANEWAPRGFSFEDTEGNLIAIFSYD